jgi:hypothetical protein
MSGRRDTVLQVLRESLHAVRAAMAGMRPGRRMLGMPKGQSDTAKWDAHGPKWDERERRRAAQDTLNCA